MASVTELVVLAGDKLGHEAAACGRCAGVEAGQRLPLQVRCLATSLWTWLWGVPGAILAVPFLVVVKAVTDNVESLQVISTFLAGDPSTKAGETPQKAPAAPAAEGAPLRNQAEARAASPPT